MDQMEDDDFIQVRIRMKKALHRQLEKAATERGASMNAEIVGRLSRSFAIDQIIGGPIVEDRALVAIAKMIASAMHHAGRTGAFMATRSADETTHWYNNAYAYDQAARAATTIIEAFRPQGKTDAPILFDQDGESLSEIVQALGAGFGRSMLEQVARGVSRSGDEVEAIARIRDELGQLRDRIANYAVGPRTTSKETWGPRNSSKKGRRR